MVKMTSNWTCTGCGKVMSSYSEVGYDGPVDSDGNPDPNNKACSPHTLWAVLCNACDSDRIAAALVEQATRQYNEGGDENDV